MWFYQEAWTGPVKNVTELIENAGGVVFKLDFGTRKADAISEWVPGFPPIFLVNSNSEISGDRLRLTLSHELAHTILHQFPNPEMEREATSFAAEFLMPRREIKASLYGLTLPKLADLKRQWKVSMQALIERAYELKTISDSQRKYLYINIGKRGYKTHEPFSEEMPDEQPQTLNRLVRAHLNELGYSVTELSDLLFIREEEEFRSLFLNERRLRLVM